MSNIKYFFRFIYEQFLEHNVRIQVIILAFAVIGHFAHHVQLIGRFMDHQSIVEAHDNDAGEMVNVAERTRWYNDNSFRYYTPLYFRLANTFKTLAPAQSGLVEAKTIMASQESSHFALMLVSLLGVYLLAFSISSFFVSDLRLRLGFGLLLSTAFLGQPIWSFYLFTAHPDLLLAGLTSFSLFWTFRWVQSPDEKKYLAFASLSWGLAISTKLSTVFFLPGFLILLFFVDRNKWKENGLSTLKWGSLSYFLSGFPQSLDVPGSLKTLFGFSRFSDPATTESFLEWWQMLFEQSWMPLVVVFVLIFWCDRKPVGGSKGTSNKQVVSPILVFLCLNLGFSFMSLKKIALVHNHYVFPFTVALVFSFAFMISEFKWFHVFRLERQPLWTKYKNPFIYLAIFGASYVWISPQPAKSLQTLSSCRPSYRAIFNETYKLAQEGKRIYATPYTPVPIFLKDKVRVHWEMNFAELHKEKPSAIVFSEAFAQRYLVEVEDYTRRTNPEFARSQEFFRSFAGKTSFTDPDSVKWNQIHKDSCGLQIWVRE